MKPKGTQFDPMMKLFATADEIKAHYAPSPGDRRPGETDEQLWASKSRRAKHNKVVVSRATGEHSTLHQHIGEHGVEAPVSLGTTGHILGGHHRIASQAEHDPNRLIPILHFENMAEARKGTGGRTYK